MGHEDSGLGMHVHHDVLIEYCYSLSERAEYINSDKPKRERETRLRLLRLLPTEALLDLPDEVQRVYAERQRVEAEWWRVHAEVQRVHAEVQSVLDPIPASDLDAFHQKWCGCKEWNGTEIVF